MVGVTELESVTLGTNKENVLLFVILFAFFMCFI